MFRLALIPFTLACTLAPAVAQDPPPVRAKPRVVVPPVEPPVVWLEEFALPELWIDAELLRLDEADLLRIEEFEMPVLADLEWQLADATLVQAETLDRWAVEEQVALAMDAFTNVDVAELALAEEWRVDQQVELATEALDRAMLALPAWPEVRWQVAEPELAVRSEWTLASEPPAPWAAADQADSLYKTARQALSRGNYQRAAELFHSLPERYPQSAYAPDALYWEAFARYRMGATAELRTALAVLEQQRVRYAAAATRADAAALATRIRGALAARGDLEAAQRLEQEAAQGGSPCDEEEMAVRVEALNALAAMDPKASRDLLSRVLARRDECSADLRRRAVFLLARQADSTAGGLLIETARSDPDAEVRAYAVRWLARVPGEAALATLENLVRANDDLAVQRAAVRGLATHPDPRARGALRAVIEDGNAPERVRRDAIAAFARDETTPQEAVWLRGAYARLDSPQLKGRIISTVARLEGTENQQWLLQIAQRPSEPVDLRAAAISAVGRKDGVAIGELVRLYDTVTERRLRERLISTYGRREEPQATDKLIEIVRTGTDPRLRRNAITALTRKEDPRTRRLLMELIDQ